MIYWGVNALNHGSSLSVFSGGDLVMHESCRSDELDPSLIYRALNNGGPDKIFWYERPWVKKFRQLRAGQIETAMDMSVIPSKYLKKNNLGYSKIIYTPHHASHAAAGYYTSPFDHCAIVVLDAIGEFECASIWEGRGDKIKRVWNRNYPNSLGLFYSAFTKLIGYRPILEEHLLQKDSELGDPDRFYDQVKSYFSGIVSLNCNLHRGVQNWPELILNDQDRLDIAAAVQRVFEEQVGLVMITARELVGTDTLVYMGGCAMNNLANRRMVESKFKKIWSLPNPGDASSSIGAVLYHTKQRIENFRKPGLVKHIEVRV